MADNMITRRTPEDARIITVLLGNAKPDELKSWKCQTCGHRVFDYYNEVRIVIDGEVREISKRPIDIMCTRQGCKTVYRIL